MFQQRLNTLTNEQLFNVSSIEGHEEERFICYATTDNRYTQYLKRMNNNEQHDLQFILQAICYNSSNNATQWNLPVYELPSHDENYRPLIKESLCKKIHEHMIPEFKARVESILLDYHIILDIEGNTVPLSMYPLVKYAIGYFEAFPISWFDFQLTDDELNEIKQVVVERSIICYDNNSANVYYIDAEHKIFSTSVPLNEKSDIVTVVISILGKEDPERYREKVSETDALILCNFI